MKTIQFDDYDRKKVISELEKNFQVKLSSIGRRKKYLRDAAGKRYCVFGRSGDWHGIPEEIVQAEESSPGDSVLVIAKKYMKSIDIYCGSLGNLIKEKSRMTFTKDRQYEFNIQLQGSSLFIKEISGLALTKLGESQYSEVEKKSEKVTDEVMAIYKKLSTEQKEQLRKALSLKTKS
jgi:hypothetical protein